ncbi:hypothetical protein [Sinobaca sp. H24]|uniref:SunI/YnzG family protein n=1 Tax=Sinobaca sp. H24 TaxID=2923376 RepID=UPI00207A76E3|nr:hypothetical protein [Sinobaca sp. H24]
MKMAAGIILLLVIAVVYVYFVRTRSKINGNTLYIKHSLQTLMLPIDQMKQIEVSQGPSALEHDEANRVGSPYAEKNRLIIIMEDNTMHVIALKKAVQTAEILRRKSQLSS